tara:strand:+ start:61 stop:285 length:225 start_codon:yes stop_codon:yes gene_type:complete
VKKFINWLKGFGFKLAIELMKSKTDWFAKKMSDSVDIPFVSEKNEQKYAQEAVDAMVALLEELAENELGKKDAK